MPGLLLRLPSILATLARAFGDFSSGVFLWYLMLTGEAQAPTVQQETVLQPPQLSQEQEAVLSDAYQQMATLFENYRLGEKLQAPPSF
jgi:hypothetical protein